MPALSEYARRKKIEYFLSGVPKSARILEIGCGSRWVGEYLRANGWTHYVGADLVPPADIVGDIRNWRERGAVPRRAKWLATIMMSISAFALQLSTAAAWITLGAPLLMLAVAIWLWMRPEP